MDAYDPSIKEFDIGWVTTKSGVKYKAQFLHAPGIDYFWSPLPGQPRTNVFNDPDESVELLNDTLSEAADSQVDDA